MDGRTVAVMAHWHNLLEIHPPGLPRELFLGKCLTGGAPLQNHLRPRLLGKAAGQ